MQLDSEGDTWLMKETQTASLRWVLAVSSMKGLNWRGCM